MGPKEEKVNNLLEKSGSTPMINFSKVVFTFTIMYSQQAGKVFKENPINITILILQNLDRGKLPIIFM